MGEAFPPLLALGGGLALWQGACTAFQLPSWLLPPPSSLVAVAWVERTALGQAMALTGGAALAGFGLSLVLGIGLAVLLAQAKWVERSLTPYALFLQTVPVVGIAPLIILWAGTGFPSVVLVAHILSVFPVITVTTAGLVGVDREKVELLRIFGASRTQMMWKLRLPSALPHIVTGARNAAGLAVIGAITGEFFAGYGARQHGLGYYIIVASGQLKTDLLFTAILASTALGWGIFMMVTMVGNRLTARWRDVG